MHGPIGDLSVSECIVYDGSISVRSICMGLWRYTGVCGGLRGSVGSSTGHVSGWMLDSYSVSDFM